MSNHKEKMIKPEDELIEILLDFIIVSATLAKKISLATRVKQHKEGEFGNVKNERNGFIDQRSSQCRGNH